MRYARYTIQHEMGIFRTIFFNSDPKQTGPKIFDYQKSDISSKKCQKRD